VTAGSRVERLVVAVVSYRRPDDLAELVPQLVTQVRAVASDGHVAARVLIVDNDADGSAAPAASAADPDVVGYVVEQRPGIAAARNRALDEAADADVLVFIDDDERPSDDWLAQLVGTWRATGAAAVTGPVHSIVDGPLDPWLAAGGTFDRWHRSSVPTGTTLASAATNNLLLDLRRLRALELRFAADLGLSGGEDTLLTRRLVAAGEDIVWCAQAPVTEHVRPDRVNRRWMLMRAFSYGTVDCRVERALASGAADRARVRVRCFVAGFSRLLYGGARALVGSAVRSQRNQALGLQTAMRGAGLVAGAAGYVHRRYRAGRG
jgi:succinoglycan biosynthesis protein ExoM